MLYTLFYLFTCNYGFCSGSDFTQFSCYFAYDNLFILSNKPDDLALIVVASGSTLSSIVVRV